MRAVCDSCAGAQPPDWKSGDLCTNCGLIARREQRCHWCAGWTPEGKFCRGCGAQTVNDESYPAARMLKHAGVDQFSIIERLTSLEPDHREHLTRMYQRQAALVARHVDDLAFVETYLRHTGRAQVLDDELTNTLPVSDERMAELKLAASVVGSDGHRLREISGSTPFGSTAELAVVAMVRLSVADTDLLDADSLEVARLALHSDNPDTVDEAVAAFGHWSVVLRTSPLIPKYELLEILEDHPSLEASIAVCLLQGNREIDRGLLASSDPDIAFAAALALCQPEPLRAALDQPTRRFAAALRLATVGVGEPLVGVLPTLHPDEQELVLAALRSCEAPFPVLHDSLMTIAEDEPGSRVSGHAIDLLIREGRPSDATRLLDIDNEDMNTTQSVIQRMGLAPADLELVARHMVNTGGRFGLHQYGVSDLAENDKLSDNFVPSVWGGVGDDEQRCQLLRFAEEQLGHRSNEELHTFVLNVMFGDYSALIRSEAWWVLKRWYGRAEFASSGPLVMEAGALERYFGTVEHFLERFAILLGDHKTLAEITLQEKLAQLLRYAEADDLAGVVAHGAAFQRFMVAVHTMMHDESIRQDIRSGAVRFLELLATMPAWRPMVFDELGSFGGTDLEFEATQTAQRIRDRLDAS